MPRSAPKDNFFWKPKEKKFHGMDKSGVEQVNNFP